MASQGCGGAAAQVKLVGSGATTCQVASKPMSPSSDKSRLPAPGLTWGQALHWSGALYPTRCGQRLCFHPLFRGPEFPEAVQEGWRGHLGRCSPLCRAQGSAGPTALHPAAQGPVWTSLYFWGSSSRCDRTSRWDAPRVFPQEVERGRGSGEQVRSWLDFNGGL